jgi:tetratricopeptide (TPR) repeat protein
VELGRIIARALEKNRELRYQSAADLKADLLQIDNSPDLTKRAGRRWSVAAAVAMAFAAVVGAALWKAVKRAEAVTVSAAPLRPIAELPLENLSPEQQRKYLASTMINVGSDFLRLLKPSEAADAFRLAVRTDPNSDAYRGLAVAYDKLKKTEEAEATWKAGIQMRPTDWHRYRDLAFFYQGHGRFSEALQYHQKVIQLTPDNHVGLRDIGILYLHPMRIPSKGIEYLQRSISIKPTWMSYVNLGQAAYRQKRYTDAIELYRKAIELTPTSAIPWAALADMYVSGFVRQRPDQLRDTYANAIEVTEEMMVTQRDENGLPVRFSKSFFRARIASWRVLTDKTRALKEIREALQLTPRSSPVLARAALVYEQSGMRDEALAFMKSAVELGYPRHTLEGWPPPEPLDPPLDRALLLVHDPRYEAHVIDD